MARVSVVMAAYNAERWIGAAIESVLAQTFTDFELIVVNDGSTDGTGEVVDGFTDKRLRQVYQENRGAAEARNRGLLEACGEYVAVHDADDVSRPDRLEKQVAFLDHHPNVTVLGSAYQLVREDGSPVGWVVRPPLRNYDLRRLLFVGNPFGDPTVTYRRAAVLDAGGYQPWISFDYDLWCRMAGEFANLPEVLVDYRQVPTAITKTAGEDAPAIREALWDRCRPPRLRPVQVAAGVAAELRGHRSWRVHLSRVWRVERERLRRARGVL